MLRTVWRWRTSMRMISSLRVTSCNLKSDPFNNNMTCIYFTFSLTDTLFHIMKLSNKLVKSPHGEGLSMSQFWCDVLNLLVGILCIINGFCGRITTCWWEGSYITCRVPHPYSEMVVFTGKRINNPISLLVCRSYV